MDMIRQVVGERIYTQWCSEADAHYKRVVDSGATGGMDQENYRQVHVNWRYEHREMSREQIRLRGPQKE